MKVFLGACRYVLPIKYPNEANASLIGLYLALIHIETLPGFLGL